MATGPARSPTADWEADLWRRGSVLERIEEWIRKPPYSTRLLRSELVVLKEDVEHARGLPTDGRVRRHRLREVLDLAVFYCMQAEAALERDDVLEFHGYLNHAERVLFYYLLRYEEVTGRTPNRLSLKRLAYEHAVAAVESDLSCDDRRLVRTVRSGTDVTHGEWLRLFRIVHGPRYETHRRRRIEQAESNRRIRRLAITTLVTLGTGLAISLGVLGGVDLPLVGRLAPPPFLVEMSDLLAFAALFGLLGATISDLLKLSKRGTATAPDELPSAMFGLWATAAKLTFGAASAVVLLVVLYSGIVPGFDATQLTPGFALGVSLAAGFSERLLLRAMEQVSV